MAYKEQPVHDIFMVMVVNPADHDDRRPLVVQDPRNGRPVPLIFGSREQLVEHLPLAMSAAYDMGKASIEIMQCQTVGLITQEVIEEFLAKADAEKSLKCTCDKCKGMRKTMIKVAAELEMTLPAPFDKEPKYPAPAPDREKCSNDPIKPEKTRAGLIQVKPKPKQASEKK